MNGQAFTEREVKVMFDHEWSVIKLDEHKYYQRVSGYGLRGVDFMAVHEDFGVVFIEMKNYTEGKLSIPQNVEDLMQTKRDDSVRLVRIVYAYFERQWYFRIMRSLGLSHFFPKDWKLWVQAKKHLDQKRYFFLGVVDY